MIRATRFASAYGAIAATVVRELVSGDQETPEVGWQPAQVFAASAAACGRAGTPPGQPAVLVAGAVRTYASMFLPRAATLLPAGGEDPSLLTWDFGGDLVYDVLWVESWDTPLPLSNTLSELGGCVRLLDLTRPFASRLYGQDVSRTTLTALPWFDTTATVGTSGRARRTGRQGAKTLLEAGSQVSAREATSGADQLEAPQAAGPEPVPAPAAGTEATGQESTAASPSVGRVRKRSQRARGVA